MRLINADEYECWACIHHQNDTGKCDTWCDASESFELREDVKEAKTAYNLDEVIGLLRNRYREMIRGKRRLDVSDYHAYVMEVVRKGGVK